MSSKRSLDSSSGAGTNGSSNKRPRPSGGPSHLTSWLGSPTLQVPALIASSAEIIDLDSVFLAHAASVHSAAQAEVFRRHVREQHAADEASHEMFAWRCLVPKAGTDGSESEHDWILKSGQDDDGEKYGGDKILKVLEGRNTVDVCVVVSRWFGGSMLGPRRFRHIESCTRSALDRLNTLEKEHSTLNKLRDLDNEISALCDKLNEQGKMASPGKKPDYSGADLAKMQRLVSARQKRIQLLRGQLGRSLEEHQEQED